MNQFPIYISAKIKKEQLKEGLYIFLFRASRIPPHLGIIYNSKLFDITLNGPTVGMDAKEFFDTIKEKYTKTIFIQLNNPTKSQNLIELIEEKVRKYNNVSKTISCLNPIKDFIQKAYGIEVASANFIFELLPILEKENIINNCFHINLDRKITDSVFQLKKYTQKDIDRCMEALDRKETFC